MADRRKLGVKDMTMTMLLVVVVTVLIALYGGNISFGPSSEPTVDDVSTVGVIEGFGHARATLDFPVVVPEGVPDSWLPNSLTVSDPHHANSGLTAVGTLAAVRGGWITPAGDFIQLVETAGDVAQTLSSEFGSARAITGTVQAGGAEWQVTTGARTEAAWARTVTSGESITTLLITGDAAEADFESLAAALASAR